MKPNQKQTSFAAVKWLPLIFEIFAVSYLFYLLFPNCFDSLNFSIFQARDLDRAQQLLNGESIFYGPELSGGGHLPGPLYYYLVAFALFCGKHWHSVYVTMMAMFSLTFGITWYFLRTQFGWLSALVAVVLPLLSKHYFGSLVYFNNSSFIYPFAAILIMCIFTLYMDLSSYRMRLIAIAALALGFGMQLHLNVLLIAASLAIFQLLAKPMRMRPLNRLESLCLILFALLSCLPYIMWRMMDSLGYPAGQMQPDFLYGLSLEPKWIEKTASTNGLSRSLYELSIFQIKRIISPRALIFLAAAIALSAAPPLRYAWSRLQQGVLNSASAEKRRLLTKQFLFMSLVLFLITFWPVVGLNRSRYLNGAAVSSVFLMVSIFEYAKARPAKVKLMAILFCALGSLLFFNLHAKRKSRLMFSMTEIRRLTEIIFEQTGWPYKTAATRLFFLNGHPSQSLRYIYQDLENSVGPRHTPWMRHPDGYFVYLHPKKERAERGAKATAAWLQRKLDPFLQRALQAGDIAVDKPLAVSDMAGLIPYYVVNKENLPVSLQNRYNEYESDQSFEIEQVLAQKSIWPKQLVARFNSCPGNQKYCDVVFLIQSNDLRNPQEPVHVKMLGRSLGIGSRRISPDWNEVAAEPYLSFHCGGRTIYKPLAWAVGSEAVRPDESSANQLLTPLQWRFHPDCKSPIQNITVGTQAVYVANMNFHYRLPTYSQTFPDIVPRGQVRARF